MPLSIAEPRPPRPSLTGVPWLVLAPSCLSGAENMALDAALAEAARDAGACVLRIYGWTRPTLSFGRNQRAHGEYDAGRAEALGVDVVRRPTGGRAVLHHREITYCVTAPEMALGSLRESYGAINALLLRALRLLGVDASLAAPAGRAPLPGPAVCFEEPVAGEIVAGGRKLVGSAQWRGEGALLQHGSILVHDDQGLAASLRRTPAAPPPPPATLAALLGRAPTLDDARDAFRRALGELNARVEEGTLDEALGARMGAHLERFADARWTWRR